MTISVLVRSEIEQLIPHAGAMVLVDRVESWSPTGIVCSSRSHHRSDNPLRRDGVLSSACGIEYGAQAMAIHGALVSRVGGGAPRAGLLVSLRDVVLAEGRLDVAEGELSICAEQVRRDRRSATYVFRVGSPDGELTSGRATVVLL